VLEPNSEPPVEKPLPTDGAWTEMLARIGEKQARLSRIAEKMGVENMRASGSRRSSLLEEIEKERGRIARELHAGAGQPLAGIKINLELLDEWSKSMPEETRQTVARLNHLADAALGQVRAVSHRLHPPDWQELSATDALKSLVDESGLTRKCRISLDLGPLAEEPPHSVKVVLYRCVQECISNVLRHSGATEFALSLSESEGTIRMKVRDNGRGIPDDALNRGGIGIPSIREHTSSVGGAFSISSSSTGTTIQISVPLTEEYGLD
jgi:signal transduction histidine kinase